MNRKPRIAIIGAGPIGLEAALYARLKGYDVTVYERGPVGGNIRHWGYVKMFSPFGMNSSEWGRAALAATGYDLPGEDAILTGLQFVDRYLEPLSRLSLLDGCLCASTPTQRIMRANSRKTELIGDPRRADEPFHLLIWRMDDDVEDAVAADVVLDCSGTYGHHNWLGAGGGPCPGELNAGSDIRYQIPGQQDTDVVNRSEERREEQTIREPHLRRSPGRRIPPIRNYVGERTLVVGAGHSAATSIIALAPLHAIDDRTQILWVTRRGGDVPVHRIVDDRLPERDRLSAAANDLASSSPAVEWLGGYVVRRIEWNVAGHKARVTLESVQKGCERHELVDQIIANVGFRPDRTIYEELQVHECYATQGPMKLAARLLGESSADCLDQTSHGPDVLRNPEPNFYILGMKSYGRSSNFLIQIGLQQIVDVFSLIEQDWKS